MRDPSISTRTALLLAASALIACAAFVVARWSSAEGTAPARAVTARETRPLDPSMVTPQLRPEVRRRAAAPWDVAARPAAETTTVDALAGTWPASRVAPPRPAPLPRREPRLPLDPATHRPPMHNPGGVNGDRPARSVPGLGETGR